MPTLTSDLKSQAFFCCHHHTWILKRELYGIAEISNQNLRDLDMHQLSQMLAWHFATERKQVIPCPIIGIAMHSQWADNLMLL